MGGFRRAIENDELLLYCQPKVHVPSAAVCGAEALVRWRHPSEGLIGPGEFVKLAESASLISPLTQWVLDAAFRQAYAWRRAGIRSPLAVNLSAVDLRHPKLIERIKGCSLAARHGIQSSSRRVDADPAGATRDAVEAQVPGCQAADRRLRHGYSSLSYLQAPVDGIKIDRSFISR
jgi:EAL domain-containing protein (putative c-di-GMP-specific phosphodiesterase class I)